MPNRRRDPSSLPVRGIQRRDSAAFQRAVAVPAGLHPKPNNRRVGRDACVLLPMGPWMRSVAVEAYRLTRAMYGSRDGTELAPLVPPDKASKDFLVPVRYARPPDEDGDATLTPGALFPWPPREPEDE